ncbi:MAG: hypothetical protein M3441_21080 [Chloroflexota bacterium]|jgi:hypothetical protein|nr:hypothetical protein [Chloroflexota bacterium]
MKRKGLDRQYDRFTPEERFRLDVEARARGDEQESRRLLERCPRHSYVMNDWAFSNRWQTAMKLADAVCLDLSRHLSNLRTIDALREMLPHVRTPYRIEAEDAYLSGHEAGSRYAWRRAGMEGDPPGWGPPEDEEAIEDDFDPAVDGELEALDARLQEADILPALLDRLEREVAQEALVVWDAFATFSESSLNIEPEKLLKVSFEPMLAGVEDLKRRREELAFEADKEHIAEYEQVLAEVWEHCLQEARRLSKAG